MFVRDNKDLELLKSSCHLNFLWKKADKDLPLYLLSAGLLMREATAVSCQQLIGGDSSFSLGMIAKFINRTRFEGDGLATFNPSPWDLVRYTGRTSGASLCQ